MAREDALRILCAADFHLGRQSSTLQAELPGVDLSAMGAWFRLCEMAVHDGADAVLLAGDVFDGLAAAYQCRAEFLRGLEGLRQAGIPVVAVAGNHDYAAWQALGPRIEGLTLLGRDGRWEEVRVRTKGGDFSVVGWSFPSGAHKDSPLALERPPFSCLPVVGLTHGDLDNAFSLYAPISRSELKLAGYDAWVLGHVHKPAVVPEVPAAYPGSPQALDFGEPGDHGAMWLKLSPRGAEFTPVLLSSVRYEEVEVQLDAEGVRENATPLLEEELERRARSLRERCGHLRSVQFRVRARLLNAVKGVKLTSDGTDLGDGSAYEVVSSARATSLSLWGLSVLPDAVGQAARLLIGLRAVEGRYEGREVDPDWVRVCQGVVERCAEKVGDEFQRMKLSVARGEGYEEITDPEGWAKEFIDARLSDELRLKELEEELA